MILSVASGKGGTGKTLVATSLAFSLKDDYKVTLLDCDVEEPNDHVFLHSIPEGREPVNMHVPSVLKDICTYCGECARVCVYHAIAVMGKYVMTFPPLCHSCGACSYLCPEKAIVEEPRQTGLVEWGNSRDIGFVQGILSVGEAMAPPVIGKVKGYYTGDGIIIRDVPPGTSCPVVEAVKGSDFCILVTEPTPFGLNDLVLAVEVMRKLSIPCGIIINRSGIGDAGVEDYCVRENLPVLMKIPLDTDIARSYSKGVTLVESMPQWKGSFKKMFRAIQEITDGKND
jgi:MinD superfamily P-loop ATPase